MEGVPQGITVKLGWTCDECQVKEQKRKEKEQAEKEEAGEDEEQMEVDGGEHEKPSEGVQTRGNRKKVEKSAKK